MIENAKNDLKSAYEIGEEEKSKYEHILGIV